MFRKNLLSTICILVLLSTPLTGNCGDESYYFYKNTTASNPKWMERLDQSKKLSELSLPGTHDSATSYYWIPGGQQWTFTQGLSLEEQLKAGIRVLDVRLACDFNYLEAYHGTSPLTITFPTILGKIQNFLRSNDSETIYMRVRNERGSDSKKCHLGSSTFDEIFARDYNLYSSLFWKPTGDKFIDENPPLSQTHGKVVIFQDNFADGKQYGIKYSNLDITDFYEVKKDIDIVDDKWRTVRGKLIESSKKPSSNSISAQKRIDVNYLSGVGDAKHWLYPWFVASGQVGMANGKAQKATGIKVDRNDTRTYPELPRKCDKNPKKKCDVMLLGVNRLALNWLRNNQTTYTGILMMDFPGRDLVSKIISTNFP